jgi:hypothetical protein
MLPNELANQVGISRGEFRIGTHMAIFSGSGHSQTHRGSSPPEILLPSDEGDLLLAEAQGGREVDGVVAAKAKVRRMVPRDAGKLLVHGDRSEFRLSNSATARSYPCRARRPLRLAAARAARPSG